MLLAHDVDLVALVDPNRVVESFGKLDGSVRHVVSPRVFLEDILAAQFASDKLLRVRELRLLVPNV